MSEEGAESTGVSRAGEAVTLQVVAVASVQGFQVQQGRCGHNGQSHAVHQTHVPACAPLAPVRQNPSCRLRLCR